MFTPLDISILLSWRWTRKLPHPPIGRVWSVARQMSLSPSPLYMNIARRHVSTLCCRCQYLNAVNPWFTKIQTAFIEDGILKVFSKPFFEHTHTHLYTASLHTALVLLQEGTVLLHAPELCTDTTNG
uniref:Uncharacterized protein n=1 Tax=Anguilla anguilla TaxID=7936 RepID=A0A0E9WZL2_ANGAN